MCVDCIRLLLGFESYFQVQYGVSLGTLGSFIVEERHVTLLFLKNKLSDIRLFIAMMLL